MSDKHLWRSGKTPTSIWLFVKGLCLPTISSTLVKNHLSLITNRGNDFPVSFHIYVRSGSLITVHQNESITQQLDEDNSVSVNKEWCHDTLTLRFVSSVTDILGWWSAVRSAIVLLNARRLGEDFEFVRSLCTLLLLTGLPSGLSLCPDESLSRCLASLSQFSKKINASEYVRLLHFYVGFTAHFSYSLPVTTGVSNCWILRAIPSNWPTPHYVSSVKPFLLGFRCFRTPPLYSIRSIKHSFDIITCGIFKLEEKYSFFHSSTTKYSIVQRSSYSLWKGWRRWDICTVSPFLKRNRHDGFRTCLSPRQYWSLYYRSWS